MPYTEEGRYLNNVFARISREEQGKECFGTSEHIAEVDGEVILNLKSDIKYRVYKWKRKLHSASYYCELTVHMQ